MRHTGLQEILMCEHITMRHALAAVNTGFQATCKKGIQPKLWGCQERVSGRSEIYCAYDSVSHCLKEQIKSLIMPIPSSKTCKVSLLSIK